MLAELLALIPGKTLLRGLGYGLLVAILGASLYWIYSGIDNAGYARGHAKATGEWAQKLSAEQLAHAETRQRYQEEQRARAEALGRAEREAREKERALQIKNDELEERLLAEQRERVSERAAFTRRIDHVAKTTASTCDGLSDEFVRGLNAALGLDSENALPGADGTLRAAGTPGAGSSTVSGLPQGKPLTSPADILAHARDYGAMCRDSVRQVNAWIDWYYKAKELFRWRGVNI